MQHRNVLYIFFFFFIVFSSSNLWAADFTCGTIKQSNSPDNVWVCPSIKTSSTELNATLNDVNVQTGQYTCEYYYPDTGRTALVCNYISTKYQTQLDIQLKQEHIKAVKALTSGIYTTTILDSFFDKLIGYNKTTFDDNEEHIKDFKVLKKLVGLIKTEFTSLYDNLYNEAKSANNYLYKTTKNVTVKPIDKLKVSYGKFVEPYIPSGNSDSRKEANTFSRFIMGMVTLDENVIDHYDSATGNLKVTSSWKNNNSVGDALVAAMKPGLQTEQNSSFSPNPRIKNLIDATQGWVVIFEQKIWGFYYDLQRRLDIGYDVIATQLLFIMMVFFSIGMAVRGGARYITNRENGHSSGEVKINEASIMKTLGVLATVFVFYISVPYDAGTKPSAANPSSEYDEISRNKSLSKVLIRMAMQEGDFYGTMMSDLGTDAFLNYVVRQQGLNYGIKEGENIIRSLLSLMYYFPAYEIVDQCRFQSGLPDDMILGGQMGVSVSQSFLDGGKGTTNKEKQKYRFYKDNHITHISDTLCQKMMSQVANRPYEIATTLLTLEERIKNDVFLRMNATSALVDNHIKMQESLGWMNMASIPYTYFMMRNQHLFYESTMDFATIEETAADYAKNIGISGGQAAIDNTMWQKKVGEAQSRLDDMNKNSKTMNKEYTRLAVYNFLPGFTTIRNEISQRLQGMFSDILRLQRNPKDAEANHQFINDMLDQFKKLMKEKVSMAAKYYDGIEKLFPIEEINSELDAAISGGVKDPIKLHMTFLKISYLVAMGIWKSGFILVFLSAIAMIIGINIVMYVINVMVHFFISPFIVVWAFATSPDGGASKIKGYLRDTLIYMLYPTILVIGVFMFIFAYELFFNIYGFVTSLLIDSQRAALELTVLQKSTVKPTEAELGMLAIYALKDFTEIMIDLVSVYVAFITINKFPEMVLKMMGVGDSAVVMLPQASEAIQSKGGGNVNPLSR